MSRPECDECGADCHAHESETDFAQWEENGLCRICNDNAFESEQTELRGLVALGL